MTDPLPKKEKETKEGSHKNVWYGVGRQVHVRGAVTKVSAAATADYWSKRPRGSQLGAWASHQSHPIASREALLAQLAEVTAKFANLDVVPVPPTTAAVTRRPGYPWGISSPFVGL